jgi:hypothetical protein
MLNMYDETYRLFICLLMFDIDRFVIRLCLSCSSALFGFAHDRSTVSSCPIHHHLINYPSDGMPLKATVHHTKDNLTNKNVDGIILSSQSHVMPYHQVHSMHHHGTCQRHQKVKRLTTPTVNESSSLFTRYSTLFAS